MPDSSCDRTRLAGLPDDDDRAPYGDGAPWTGSRHAWAVPVDVARGGVGLWRYLPGGAGGAEVRSAPVTDR